MNKIISQVEANFYSQVDYFNKQMSLQRQDFLRLLVYKLGQLQFAPISIYSAINGLFVSTSAYGSRIENKSAELINFLDEIKFCRDEVVLISDKQPIAAFSLGKKKSLFLKWQVLEVVENTKIGLNSKAIELVGAYVLLILSGCKVNRSAPDILFKLLHSDMEFLNESESRALAKIEFTAHQKFSELNRNEKTKLSFNEILPHLYLWKINYADAKTRQCALDYKTYHVNKFIDIAHNLREKCESGDTHALKCIIACFLGIPFKYIDQVLLIGASNTKWKLAIDVDAGVILFDLDVVAPFGVKVSESHYRIANKILVKPLPEFVWNELLKFKQQSQGLSSTLGELLGVGNCYDHPVDFSEARLINSIARVAIHHLEVDVFEAGLIANDFRLFPSSKLYYHQTSRQKIWDVSQRIFATIGWGNASPFVEGLDFGSCGVMKDQGISDLFDVLGRRIENNRPSNRSSLQSLIEFHNAIAHYTATLAVFCLSLRDENPIKVFADDAIGGKNYLLINDKNVHGDASTQPVTITNVLKIQLELYRIHCGVFARRIRKNAFTVNSKFLKRLDDIFLGEHVPLFVTDYAPTGLSSHQLSEAWPIDLIENFGRHFWETKFLELGIASRESSAHLRHQNACNLNWSGASDLVLDTLIRRINFAQDILLKSLNINAIYGLARRYKS